MEPALQNPIMHNGHKQAADMAGHRVRCNGTHNLSGVYIYTQPVLTSYPQLVNLVDLNENLGAPNKFPAGRAVWDAHGPDVLCFTHGNRVVGWDLRSNQ